MGQNRPRRALSRLLAALALAIQVFVVQTHIDGFAFASPVAASVASSSLNQNGPLTCLICEAAATARTGITPAPAVLTLIDAAFFVGAAAPALPISESRPSLPWQSRAPPLSA